MFALKNLFECSSVKVRKQITILNVVKMTFKKVYTSKNT